MEAYVCRFFGDVEYEMNQGSPLLIEHYLDSSWTFVIHNSAIEVVVEEFNYASSSPTGFSPNKSLIDQALDPNRGAPPSHGVFHIESYTVEKLKLRKQTIDYFFDDELPRKIEVRDGNDKRYWIHTLNQHHRHS